jgi:hypothetical protein
MGSVRKINRLLRELEGLEAARRVNPDAPPAAPAFDPLRLYQKILALEDHYDRTGRPEPTFCELPAGMEVEQWYDRELAKAGVDYEQWHRQWLAHPVTSADGAGGIGTK